MVKASSVAFVLFSAFASMAGGTAARAAAPANTLVEMFANIRSCLGNVAIAPGTEVTLQFSLNRRGGLIGKPRITYAHWTGDEDARKKSAESISEGFGKCLPLPITDQLGGAIAGRPIAFRLRASTGREENI